MRAWYATVFRARSVAASIGSRWVRTAYSAPPSTAIQCRRYSSSATSTPNGARARRYASHWSGSVSAMVPSRSNRTPRITSDRPRAERRVDLSPSLVPPLEARAPRLVGVDHVRPHHGGDRLREVGVEPTPDGAEHGAPEARALWHVAHDERNLQGGREDSEERRTLRHAAAHPEPGNGGAVHRTDLLAIPADRERDVLEEAAQQVAARRPIDMQDGERKEDAGRLEGIHLGQVEDRGSDVRDQMAALVGHRGDGRLGLRVRVVAGPAVQEIEQPAIG